MPINVTSASRAPSVGFLRLRLNNPTLDPLEPVPRPAGAPHPRTRLLNAGVDVRRGRRSRATENAAGRLNIAASRAWVRLRRQAAAQSENVIQGTDEPTGRLDAPILLVTSSTRRSSLRRRSRGSGCSSGCATGAGQLSLVACPAGFGKSTLLAAWREREARDRPVAWVTLDEGDNDAVVLWSHVIEALGRACPGLAHGALGGAGRLAPLLEVVLPRLVNALAEQDEVVLVLDDFHRLSSAVGARERRVVRRSPAVDGPARALHPRRPGAAAGRAARPRAAARAARGRPALHARRGGRVPQRPARAGAGRRRRRAARRAHRGLARGDLPGGAVARGQGRTSPAWSGRSTARARTSSTSSRARCSAPTSRTCRRSCSARRCSSGCARRCATRCSGTPASAGALESLARTNLFLVPLDDRRRWFRFHHLFAQILRVELERREPGLVAGLHRRAYEWHSAFGTTDEAIHHAVAARAFGEAGQLIAETWVHYVNAGRTTSVLDWLVRFPDEVLGADARLLLVQGMGLGAARPRGRHARARSRACASSAGWTTGPLPDGFASLESSVSVLRRGVRLGRRVGGARARRAVGRARGARRAVAAGGHLGARLGATTATGSSTLAERWLQRDGGARPARRPVDRRRRARSRTCR